MKSRRLAGHGFSLIELSVVVAIMSVVAVMGLEGAAAFMSRGNYAKTQDKLAVIDNALRQYYRTFGRLPCPTPYDLSPNDPTYYMYYGFMKCVPAIPAGTPVPTIYTNAATDSIGGKVYGGGVPFRELNLPVDAAIDAYGNKFIYNVTVNLTVAGSAGNSFGYNPAPGIPMTAAQAATAGIDGIEVRTGRLEQPCDTTSCQTIALPTYDYTTNTGAAYAVISVGADRRGGRNKFGVLQKNCIASVSDDMKIDSQNCLALSGSAVPLGVSNIPANVIYDSRYNAGNQEANYFDDLVIWRSRNQL